MHYENINQEQIRLLTESCVERFDDLLETLGIDNLHKGNRLYHGTCPIHGGDNPNSCNIWLGGHTNPLFWRCNTAHCETTFKSSLVGFVRGVLSANKNGWSCKADDKKIVPFYDAINFLLKFSNQSLTNLEVDTSLIEKRRFSSQVHTIQGVTADNGIGQRKNSSGLLRMDVRRLLEIPAQYYLNRGYSKEVLNEFDVGLCRRPNREMSGRVVIPIYGSDGEQLIGATGRSIFEKCPKCSLWHNEKQVCPEPRYSGLFSKWRHSKDFRGELNLFNLGRAKRYIQESGVVVLTESPGNVLRLYEAGIKNAVATFGTNFSDFHKILLDKTGVGTIIINGDRDSAGENFCDLIQEKCRKTYRLYFLSCPTGNDIGEMNVDAITKDVKPFIDKITSSSLLS